VRPTICPRGRWSRRRRDTSARHWRWWRDSRVGTGVAPASTGHVVDTNVAPDFDLVEREHDEVGGLADLQHTAIVETEERRVLSGHRVHGLFDRQETGVAHVAREQIRGVAGPLNIWMWHPRRSRR
jgi:hypothetical protein